MWWFNWLAVQFDIFRQGFFIPLLKTKMKNALLMLLTVCTLEVIVICRWVYVALIAQIFKSIIHVISTHFATYLAEQIITAETFFL